MKQNSFKNMNNISIENIHGNQQYDQDQFSDVPHQIKLTNILHVWRLIEKNKQYLNRLNDNEINKQKPPLHTSIMKLRLKAKQTQENIVNDESIQIVQNETINRDQIENIDISSYYLEETKEQNLSQPLKLQERQLKLKAQLNNSSFKDRPNTSVTKKHNNYLLKNNSFIASNTPRTFYQSIQYFNSVSQQKFLNNNLLNIIEIQKVFIFQQKEKYPKEPSQCRNNSAKSNQRQPAYSNKSSNSLVPNRLGLKISAQSWAVFDGETGNKILSANDQQRRQIASITKVMTCWVTLQLSWRLNLPLETTLFQVSREASKIKGTSANLRSGEKLSIWDLLHGLMLPSGNDSALVLAENFTFLLKEQPFLDDQNPIEIKINRFIDEMNKWAKIFKLLNTQFSNPHGLGNHLNLSTAEDVGKLCSIVSKDPLISQIVVKQIYIGIAQTNVAQFVEKSWVNTNLMLKKNGYIGLKTGITNMAGPCLASHYKTNQYNFIIVLLNCQSQETKWEETESLLQIAIESLEN